MRFSVAEPLPGAIILQINIAGASPGDVGVWNSQVTIGGTAETTIRNVCTNQDTSSCMGAFLGVHLTSSSSAYLQNIWIWTADHNLDGGSGYTVISTGRGLLCEATKGTWLVGTGSEHNWLYNYNFNSASNVFSGLMQTESPYMQGNGATLLAPAPCKSNLEAKILQSRLSQEQFVLRTSLETACSQILPGGIIADSSFLHRGSPIRLR